MRREGSRGGFTLAELMVAVAVLIVIIVATSKIFGIASRVAGLGEATADIIQETGTIERQLREDFKRLSDDGFILIRCVRVRNDVNLRNNNGPLLDPARPPAAFLRADQLFFFVDGAQQMATLGTRGTNVRGLGVSSRVYWGHGIQLSLKQAEERTAGAWLTHDFKLDFDNPLLPCHRGAYDTVGTLYQWQANDPADEYETTNAPAYDATQPLAPKWLLVRHAVVMADDGDDHPERFMYGNRTAYWIDHHPVFHGRVDGVAQQLQDVRGLVTVAPNPFVCATETKYERPWYDPNYSIGDQRRVIAALCGRGALLGNGTVATADLPIYTRAERVAPGMLRVDQALTNHVIATGCSSFTVDWTWGPGTGELRDPDGMLVEAPGPNLVYELGNQCAFYDSGSDDICLRGVQINADPDNAPAFREQPWFGLEDPQRGVYRYGTDDDGDDQPDLWPWWGWARTIAPDNVEEIVYEDNDIVVYEAIFGYNRGEMLNADDNPDPVIYGTSIPDCTRVGYTPWPAAVRITMTLHDQQQRFGEGREVQFVVDLPRPE